MHISDSAARTPAATDGNWDQRRGPSGEGGGGLCDRARAAR